MAFSATCPYCGQGARAPEHLLGASRQCPRCKNYFTLVPKEEAALVAASNDKGDSGENIPTPVSQRNKAHIANESQRAAGFVADNHLPRGIRLIEPLSAVGLFMS